MQELKISLPQHLNMEMMKLQWQILMENKVSCQISSQQVASYLFIFFLNCGIFYTVHLFTRHVQTRKYNADINADANGIRTKNNMRPSP